MTLRELDVVMENKIDIFDMNANWLSDSYCGNFTEYFDKRVVLVGVCRGFDGGTRVEVTLEVEEE